MAWAHVQDAGATWSATTTSSPAFGSNTTIGNIVIATVSIKSTSVTASLSGFGVATWYQLNTMRDMGLCTIQIFGGVATTAATTLTVTLSSSSTGAVSMMEFSGGTLNVDGLNSYISASTTAQPTVTYTPQSANSLVIAVLTPQAGSAMTTNTANFNNLTVQTVASTITNATGWAIQTTATTITTSYTLTTANNADRTMIGLQAQGTTTTAYAVQSITQFHSGTPTSTNSFTPGAGRALVVVAALLDTVGIGALTVSDNSGSNVWAAAGTITAASLRTATVWYAMNVAAVSTAVTYTFSGTAPRIWATVFEYQGLAPSSMLDAAGAGTSGSSTAVATGNVTTTNVNDLLIGSAILTTNGIVSAESANYGDMGIITSQNNFSGFGASRLVSATGTYSNTWTSGTTSNWAGIIVSFKVDLAAFVTLDYADPLETYTDDTGEEQSWYGPLPDDPQAFLIPPPVPPIAVHLVNPDTYAEGIGEDEPDQFDDPPEVWLFKQIYPLNLDDYAEGEGEDEPIQTDHQPDWLFSQMYPLSLDDYSESIGEDEPEQTVDTQEWITLAPFPPVIDDYAEGDELSEEPLQFDDPIDWLLAIGPAPPVTLIDTLIHWRKINPASGSTDIGRRNIVPSDGL